MYGSPALKVRGNLLTCLAVHKSAEPGSIAVRIDFDQRAGLLAEAADTYYLTDHYRNYPVVLVRLSRVRIDELRDLLGAAWRFVTAQTSRQASRSTAWWPRGPCASKPRSVFGGPTSAVANNTNWTLGRRARREGVLDRAVADEAERLIGTHNAEVLQPHALYLGTWKTEASRKLLRDKERPQGQEKVQNSG
jgi:hypothetical protein